MGQCGCISSRNNNNNKNKRSKSVGNPSNNQNGKLQGQDPEDIQKITKSIFDGEPVLKKAPSKDEDAAKKKVVPALSIKDVDEQNSIARNFTVVDAQAFPTVVREQRTQLGVSEITTLTLQNPQFTTGIVKEDSDGNDTMVFNQDEDIIEDVDDSMIDQIDIGIRIHTQESYKNVNAIKPSNDSALRDFDRYKSELEVISKTRNTVISMMVKNPRLSFEPNARMSFEPNSKPQLEPKNVSFEPQAPNSMAPKNQNRLFIRPQESVNSIARPLETDTSALFRHLKPKAQVSNSQQSELVRVQKSNSWLNSSIHESRISRQRKKLSHTESVNQPQDRNSDSDSRSFCSSGW